MQARDVQLLLAKSNYYSGAIDGDLGPKTRRGIEIVESNGGHDWSRWSERRRMVAAAQAILAAMGYEPGAIDGLFGHNTREALTAFHTEQATGAKPVLARVPQAPVPGAAHVWPRQADMERVFGARGSSEATAGQCNLPFPFIIAWNTSQRVSRFSCHRKVAGAFTRIFADAARHYGEARFRQLRLDRFGGCFNDRAMRGGTRPSTHAYGVAVDLDPENNQLRWGRDRAAFARSDYDPFWKIVEAAGLVPLGRVANMDWMHFQAARL